MESRQKTVQVYWRQKHRHDSQLTNPNPSRGFMGDYFPSDSVKEFLPNTSTTFGNGNERLDEDVSTWANQKSHPQQDVFNRVQGFVSSGVCLLLTGMPTFGQQDAIIRAKQSNSGVRTE